MRALVTGSSGFAGSHLVDHLRAQAGLEVFGVVNHPNPALPETVLVADLRDGEATKRVLEEVRPDLVFHLAAQAAVQLSWSNASDTLVNNILAQLNVIEGLLSAGLRPKVLIVGSADEYGLVRPDELPVKEENPLRPNSPYGVSKITQDMMGYQYFLSHRLPVIRTRPFNHIGPGQSDNFAASSFAKQIAEVEAKRRDPVLHVGNLGAKRDFTDVRDTVRAYLLLLRDGTAGEVYNIGSGRSVTIGALLDSLLAQSRATIEVRPDPARMRPSDTPELVCDFAKLKRATGWEPEIPLERTLRDLLNFWRERVALEDSEA